MLGNKPRGSLNQFPHNAQLLHNPVGTSAVTVCQTRTKET